MDKKRILVTGGSGFIGKHFLEMIDTEYYDVTVISRDPQKKIPHLTELFYTQKADLNDLDSLIKAFQNIDIIVNMAAEVRNDTLLSKTNIEGSKNIISAASENNVSKIIHLSSVGVVGMQYSLKETIVDENSTCLPKNEYERTKLSSERILVNGCRENNIQLQILRPTNVFGENHPFDALKSIVTHLNNEKPMLVTKNALFNYVYVKDVAEVLINFLKDDSPNGTFNVGESQTIQRFTHLIQTTLNKPKRVYIIPDFIVKLARAMGMSKFNVVSNRVSYSDLKLKSFFKYKFGLEKGVINTIEYYKQKGILK